MTERPVDESNSEPLLKRWSRRKQSATQAASTEATTDLPTVPSQELAPHEREADLSEIPGASDPDGHGVATTESKLPPEDDSAEDEVILSDEDMPALESLTKDSDVSCFLNKGVSDALRKKALRHLFMLPAFNIRDGLNDYDEDYTYFEPLGDTITSDMKFHAARKAREEEAAEALAKEELAAKQAEMEDAEGDSEEELQSDESASDETETSGETDEENRTEESGGETTDSADLDTVDEDNRDEDNRDDALGLPVLADDGRQSAAGNNNAMKAGDASVHDVAMLDAESESATSLPNVLVPTDRTSNE